MSPGDEFFRRRFRLRRRAWRRENSKRRMIWSANMFPADCGEIDNAQFCRICVKCNQNDAWTTTVEPSADRTCRRRYRPAGDDILGGMQSTTSETGSRDKGNGGDADSPREGGSRCGLFEFWAAADRLIQSRSRSSASALLRHKLSIWRSAAAALFFLVRLRVAAQGRPYALFRSSTYPFPYFSTSSSFFHGANLLISTHLFTIPSISFHRLLQGALDAPVRISFSWEPTPDYLLVNSWADNEHEPDSGCLFDSSKKRSLRDVRSKIITEVGIGVQWKAIIVQWEDVGRCGKLFFWPEAKHERTSRVRIEPQLCGVKARTKHSGRITLAIKALIKPGIYNASKRLINTTITQKYIGFSVCWS